MSKCSTAVYLLSLSKNRKECGSWWKGCESTATGRSDSKVVDVMKFVKWQCILKESNRRRATGRREREMVGRKVERKGQKGEGREKVEVEGFRRWVVSVGPDLA